MDQTAYTSEVQLCADGEAKSVDREKRIGQLSRSLESKLRRIPFGIRHVKTAGLAGLVRESEHKTKSL